MTDFSVSDFVAFDTFDLRWRFTDPNHAQLSPDLLRRIRPFAPPAASQLNSARVALCTSATSTARLQISPDHELVTQWLRSLPVADAALIVVSWDERNAVLTDWDLFIDHWDDFCYPSSDDVAVYPADDRSWVLCYSHWEVLDFRSITTDV